MRRLFALLALMTFTAPVLAAATGYAVVDRIALPNGGWDYAAVDTTTDTLFVARTGGVDAVALGGGHAVRSFGATEHSHAVIPLPGGHLAVTSGRDDSLRLFDQASGQERARIAVGNGPDGAAADPALGAVLVVDGEGGTVSVVDPAKQSVLRTIKLAPGLEFPALDRRGILFVNNEDESGLYVADPRTGRALGAIALTGCDGPTGLGYDARTDRLIAACANGKAAVIDAARRKLIGLIVIGAKPDAVIVDAARRLAFIPCGGSGTLVEIALDGAHGPKAIATVPTEAGARTGALDPRSGRLYLPTGQFTPAAGEDRKPVPGSTHLLVVAPVAAR